MEQILNFNYEKPRLLELFKRLALISSKNRGKILRSGHCSRPFDGLKLDLIEVEWLWSCSLWKEGSIKELRFPDLYGGYVLGEDILLSIMARRYGKLFCNPRAKLAHYKPIKQSIISKEQIEKSLILREELFKTYFSKTKKSFPYLWTGFCEIFYYSVIIITSRKNNLDLKINLVLNIYFKHFKKILTYRFKSSLAR